MTYLQIINAVLRRLREDTVAAYNTSDYSTLIGDFVNEVKREVEDSWNWTQLRSTVQITTASGTYQYTLAGGGDRYRILQVINDTEDYDLQKGSYNYMNRWLTQNGSQNGKPFWYDINGQSGGDPIVNLYPIPDGAYNINFNMIIPQDDLAASDTELTVPDYPVLLGAYARALSERGEDGGLMYAEAQRQYDKALGDAIALDAGNHPYEMDWIVE